jgi:leucyl-tRNA synthetase
MDEETPRFRYDARLANEIELRLQDRWERGGTFESPDHVAGRPKFYLVDFFPYPAASGCTSVIRWVTSAPTCSGGTCA